MELGESAAHPSRLIILLQKEKEDATTPHDVKVLDAELASVKSLQLKNRESQRRSRARRGDQRVSCEVSSMSTNDLIDLKTAIEKELQSRPKSGGSDRVNTEDALGKDKSEGFVSWLASKLT